MSTELAVASLRWSEVIGIVPSPPEIKFLSLPTSRDKSAANFRHGLVLAGKGSGARRSLLLRVGQYWRSRFPPNLHPKSTA